MKYLRSTVCIAFISFLTLAVAGQPRMQTNPSPGEDVLEREIHGTDRESYPSTVAFTVSLQRAQVPGGTVEVRDCDTSKVEQLWQPLGAPLRQVLDNIVATDQQYSWHIENGLINLLPTTGEPMLLQTRISGFRVKNVISSREALSALLAVNDVKKKVEDLRLQWGINVFVSGESSHPREFSVQCKDVTLRQALNAIARAEGRAVWHYVETHCEGRNEVVIKF